MIHINIQLFLSFLLFLTTSFSFAKEVEISFRNMPEFALLDHKKQNFCFISYNKFNYYKEIKSYFYQAAGIELHQVTSLTKPSPWSQKCKYLVKTEVDKSLSYNVHVFDKEMRTIISRKKMLSTNNYTDIQKMLADIFVPYTKKVCVKVELNHDVLTKAFVAYKSSRSSLSIELLNSLKTILEKKKFHKPFTTLEYETYKNTLFQIAVYYETMSQLNKALLYYQLSLRHNPKKKDTKSSIERVLKRLRDLPKLQKLFRKVQ